MTELVDDLRLLREVDADLASKVAGLQTLEQVLEWMKSEDLELANVEIIAQDEYSLDFVVPHSDGRYLVWGIT